MSYTKLTDFAVKDALLSGNPAKVIRGVEFDAEFNEIVAADALNTKAATLAASSGSSLVGFIQSGAGAVATTVQAKLWESVSVKDFGAVGDGVTDDTAAIQTALTKLGALGGGNLLLGPETFNLATDGYASGAVFTLTNFKGVTLDGQGATIKTGSSATNLFWLFVLNNCTGVTFKNINFVSQYTTLDSAHGVMWVSPQNGTTNVHFENCTFNYGNMGICPYGANGPVSARVSQISAINCYFFGVYYPQQFNCTGDNYSARNIVTRNCGRSYMPINVKNHDVQMDSQHGGPFSDVLLKCYTSANTTTQYWAATYPKLENIRLDYTSTGRYAGSGNCGNAEEGMVAIDFQLIDGAVAGTVRNINVRVNVINTTDLFASNFVIRKYNTNANPDPTGRGHLMKDVVFSGCIDQAQNTLSSNPAIRICTTPTGADGTANWTGENISQVVLRDLTIDGTNTAAAQVWINGQSNLGTSQNTFLENVTASGQISIVNATAGNIGILASVFSNMTRLCAEPVAFTPVITAQGGGNTSGMSVTASYTRNNGTITVIGQITINNNANMGTGAWQISLPVPTGVGTLPVGSFFANPAGTQIAGAVFANPSASTMFLVGQGLANYLQGTSYSWANGNTLFFSMTYNVT